MRPAKTQVSLGICPVWSESSLCAQWVAKDPSFLHVGREDSDQTGQMPRLIWVFVGRTVTLLVLSCGGSYLLTSDSNMTIRFSFINHVHHFLRTWDKTFRRTLKYIFKIFENMHKNIPNSLLHPTLAIMSPFEYNSICASETVLGFNILLTARPQQ